MDAVQGLLELIVGPGVGHEDDVVGEVEAVAFGHALDPGEHDGDGLGVLTALLEDRGFVTAALLVDAAIEDYVADVSFGKPAGEVVQRVVEGAEHYDLLAAFEDLGDEGQDGGGLWDVGGAGTRRQRKVAVALAEGQRGVGLAPTRAQSQVSTGSPGWATRCSLEVGGGDAESLKLSANVGCLDVP